MPFEETPEEQITTRFGAKWDRNFFDLARLLASWSKDPKTKVGAVIVDDHKRVISHGYNGFPRFTDDSPELYADPEYKAAAVIHAEKNAIVNSVARPEGGILYVTYMPCTPCAGLLIQSGIVEVHAPVWPEDKPHRWEDWRRANDLLRQAGVAVWLHPGEDR